MVKVEHYYLQNGGAKVSVFVFDTGERITTPLFNYLDSRLRNQFFMPYFDAIYDLGVLTESKTGIAYIALCYFNMTKKRIQELEAGFEIIMKETL